MAEKITPAEKKEWISSYCVDMTTKEIYKQLSIFTPSEGDKMRPSELEGKTVVETGAKIIGTVSGIEIDLPTWKVTHLKIELADELTQTLGYKKPFLGHVEILLSVDAVKAVADVVTLNKAIEELKDVIEPPKRVREAVEPPRPTTESSQHVAPTS